MPTEPLVDLGIGDPIILLHGLFGNLSNWRSVIDEFSSSHRVIVPRLPLYSIPISKERLDNLVDYLDDFIETNELKDIVIMGNSLGGHVAILYACRRPDRVKTMVLAGSSGLFENSFGGTFPHVKNYDYIREQVENTFHKKEVVTKELVDEIYHTMQNRLKVLSIIGLAKAAQRHSVAELLGDITAPTLLIWGRQDTITPLEVAEDFHKRLSNSNLIVLDDCGHVPMMEQPEQFNFHVRNFIEDETA